MIKSNTVKRLIGTGAIAFAFFSASLAMGTPVNAEGQIDSVTATSGSHSPKGQAYNAGRRSGFENGHKLGSATEAKEPNSEGNNIQIEYPETTPYDETPELREIYWQGYQETFAGGYITGWKEKNSGSQDMSEQNMSEQNMSEQDMGEQDMDEQGMDQPTILETIYSFFYTVYTTVGNYLGLL